MYKKLVRFSLYFMILLAGRGSFGKILKNINSYTTPTAEKSVRILMIGNSYTYFNNLPLMIERLAASSENSKLVQTEMIAEGGATLKDHWEKGDAVDAIRRASWDYVVLQEQSELGVSYFVEGENRITNPEYFHRYARLFDAEIKKAGARTVFFQTWPKEEAPRGDYEMLAYAYNSIARELGALLVPCGTVWQSLRKKHPTLDLYVEDGSHPTGIGSYLAANVFHTVLWRESTLGFICQITGTPSDDEGILPTDSSATLVALSKSDAELIQRAAWHTFEEMQANGGYLDAPKPAPIALPELPTGSVTQESAMIGLWKGELRAYPRFLPWPAKMEIRLNKQDDNWELSATVIWEGRRTLKIEVAELEVNEMGLSFIDPKGPNGGIVKYQGVFTGESLSGIAEIIVKDQPIYAIGSWEVWRQEQE